MFHKGILKRTKSTLMKLLLLLLDFESIQSMLPLPCYLKFKLQHMDLKSAFLNDFLLEEVHVKQPFGIEDLHLSYHVCKLKKVLYDLE